MHCRAEAAEFRHHRAFDEAVTDADTFFAQELAGAEAVTIGGGGAVRITQPVRADLGEANDRVSPAGGNGNYLSHAQSPLAWPRA